MWTCNNLDLARRLAADKEQRYLAAATQLRRLSDREFERPRRRRTR